MNGSPTRRRSLFERSAKEARMPSEWLRGMIRDAARQAFTALAAEHPGEPFYTFSLQTMCDATGVYAHANTEDGYLRAVERYREWKPEAVDERYCRWYW